MSLLKNDPFQIDRLSVQQIIALCGNGKLTDNSECSRDFREYLQIAKSTDLLRYQRTCLESSFERSGNVLQDVVNELGRRLDYTAENGLYQGRQNAVGFDGIWADPGGHTIVVEVKTTDAYVSAQLTELSLFFQGRSKSVYFSPPVRRQGGRS